MRGGFYPSCMGKAKITSEDVAKEVDVGIGVHLEFPMTALM